MGIRRAIRESNAIERVYGDFAFEKALRAYRYIKKNINKLSVDVILMAHRKMLYGINTRIAGRLRNCDVFIGGHRKIFISECLLKDEINALIERINHDIYEYHDSDEQHRDLLCKLRHVEFENIHPFEDGNGRVGRMIYYAMRLAMNLPLNHIESSKKRDYYKWFKN